jgi:hypothetical protein
MLRLLQIKRSGIDTQRSEPGHDTSEETEMHVQRTRRVWDRYPTEFVLALRPIR